MAARLYSSVEAFHTIMADLSSVLLVFLAPYGTGILRPVLCRSYRPCYLDNLLHHQTAAEACGASGVDIQDNQRDSEEFEV